MENFYENEFEQFLKGQADQFKMEPTRKTWHGLYNNFHPGRRWPSVATGLMIILLLSITNNLNTKQRHDLLLKSDAYQKTLLASLKFKNKKPLKIHNNTDDIIADNIVSDLINYEEINNHNNVNGVAKDNNFSAIIEPLKNAISNTKLNDKTTSPATGINTASEVLETIRTSSIPSSGSELLVNSEKNDPSQGGVSNEDDKANFAKPLAVDLLRGDIIPNTTPIQKNENITSIFKKRAPKFTIAFYFTPTLNYRKIRSSSINPTDYSSSLMANQNIVDEATSQHMLPGLELGTSLSLRLIKNLELFSGIQFNYSGYNIKANYTHPVQSSLYLNMNGTPQEQYFISNYSNDKNQSSLTLHNYNIETSIPIGLKYTLTTNNNVSLNIFTSLQPTLILFSKSYLLSSDSRNYVSDPDLKRSINLNNESGFSIGFRGTNLKYEIGPEMRYQLLSNFNKEAPYKEHLTSYGVKFVISH